MADTASQLPDACTSIRFRGEVLLQDGEATGIRVPPEVVASLGVGRQPPVRVTINGHSYRSSVAPVDGGFLLPLSAQQGAGAGIAVGDPVDVDLELDTEPQRVG